jgi:hypothetical protein
MCAPLCQRVFSAVLRMSPAGPELRHLFFRGQRIGDITDAFRVPS